MADVVRWLAQRLEEALPAGDLPPGEIGRRVHALAEAWSGLEGRSATVFGMHLKADDRARCAELIPACREGLERWQAFLREHVGDAEASAFVGKIAHEHGVRLRTPAARALPALDERSAAALDRLAACVKDPAALTAIWRAEDRFVEPDDEVQVWWGEPDAEALAAMAEAFEGLARCPFPPLLERVLARFNGLAVFGDEEPGRAERVAPRELGEPVLWPAEGTDFGALDAEVSDHVELFPIGEEPEQGFLCLGVPTGDGGGADALGVFWVERPLRAGGGVHRLADDVAQLFEDWCAAGLCLPLLLQRRRVPGWGG